jgi:hypothetical protein
MMERNPAIPVKFETRAYQSTPCANGKHYRCYKLECTCDCHKQGLAPIYEES